MCDRSNQLATNQLKKTEVTLKAVEEFNPDQKIYRSLGRMFILQPKQEIANELKLNAKSLNQEIEKYAELRKTYEAKREHLTKQVQEVA